MSTRSEEERYRRKPGDASTGSNSNPACDQCRTRKIRCDRKAPICSNCGKANLPCDFTNKGKRINHTKQLVEDFSALNGRLESIDASIAKITRRLDLRTGAAEDDDDYEPQDNLSTLDDDLNHFTRQSSPMRSADSNGQHDVRRPSASSKNAYHITRHSDGAETYHGPTAGRSLFQQMRILVDDLLASLKSEDEDEHNRDQDVERLRSLMSIDPIAKTELRKCGDTFPFHAISPTVTIMHDDGSPVSRPPQSFVESSLDFFIEEFNTVLPLFDEGHLRSMVKEQYALGVHSSTTDAWNLCFNNIVVLAMGVKLTTASLINVRRKDWEDDVFLPFLSNSRRAFARLSDYLSPRLINIQALATLALVAADYFPHGIFESLVHKACALAREMGLERCLTMSSETPSAVTVERRRVFWSLYVLDKRRTFLTGKPCDLYLAETDLETPKLVHDEMWAKNALARIHMMSIWEEIWKSLYSSRALRYSARYKEEAIGRLRQYLKAWVTHHKSIIERPEEAETGNATCMRLELRYSFHVAQILVHRCVDKSENRQQQVNNARAALKIIKDVARGPPSTSGVSLLARIFRTYTILPLYEIHKNTMFCSSDESTEDMELMRSCIDALSHFVSPIHPSVYFNRLSEGLEWGMSIALILQKAQDRQSVSAATMSRSVSTNKPPGSPFSRASTGKRDSESVDDESASSTDSRSQRRRTDVPDTTTLTTNTSQSSSTGPATPASGYFSDIRNIDPFRSVDAKLAHFSSMGNSHLGSPPNEPAEFGMSTADMCSSAIDIPVFTNPSCTLTESKNPLAMSRYAFDYPTPIGTVNPSRTNLYSSSSLSTPPSPHNNLIDPASLVARVPPASRQALTSITPTPKFTPETFSAFGTNLLDDSFTNVGQHSNMPTMTPASAVVPHQHPFPHHIHHQQHPGLEDSHFSFEFAPEHTGFGFVPIDHDMARVDVCNI